MLEGFFEKLNKAQGEPPPGAPRNEKEAAFLEEILNRHHDYIKKKERLTEDTFEVKD